MTNPLVSLVVYPVEFLISYVFFSSAFERRYRVWAVLGIGCILFAVGSGINLLFRNNAVINILTSILVNCLFARLCFSGKRFQSYFYAFILVVIGIAWELIVVSAVSALTGRAFFDYKNELAIFILECPTCKALYFLTVLILSRVIKPGGEKKSLPFTLFLYPITTLACHIIFWYICAQPGLSNKVQNLLAVASMILLVSTVLLFITYQNQIEADREAMQLKSLNARLQTEKSYYTILEQQNQHLMEYAHDAKNHLAAIGALNEDPQIGGYLSKLSEQLTDYTRYCHSGNKLLDVIIHKYCVDCEIRGIRFEYDVKSCNLSGLSDLDLVAILGNLIDNAIAAAEQSGEKHISLETAWRNDYSVIVLCNSCDAPPKAVSGNLLTSKPNQALHGFGVKSVKRTVKKYDGDFEWIYNEQNHTFTVTVMLGVGQRQPAFET